MCWACGRPRIPAHDDQAPGPTVRHTFRPTPAPAPAVAATSRQGEVRRRESDGRVAVRVIDDADLPATANGPWVSVWFDVETALTVEILSEADVADWTLIDAHRAQP